MSKLTVEQIRQRAEADLNTFAVLVNPTRVYGDIHHEVFDWLQSDIRMAPEAAGFIPKPNQLVLLPRAHQKSHAIAIWVAWYITRTPWTTVLYVSATEGLALQQVYAIKQILESKVYRKYWPEMIHEDEAKREKWSASEVKVDHPKRAEMNVRDPTLLAKSVGANTTGLHCDVLVYDDIVVPDNAYSLEGRTTVSSAVSQFSSILNPGGICKAVGTRYHPNDVYGTWQDTKVELYDEQGEMVGEYDKWITFERAVEEGGNYIWPREQHPKTQQWYGFNPNVLAGIRAEYFSQGERSQFYAQYYNNPNDTSEERVDMANVPRYDRKHLIYADGSWQVNGKRLAVYAGADLAYTTGKRSDYTAFAVLGVDAENFVYILDLEQIKTDKYDDYYKTVMSLHAKWGFRKIMIETNAGANLVVRYLQDEVRRAGESLIIDGRPSASSKHERVEATLVPAYAQQRVHHYRGGYMGVYEEQVLLPRPKHDDLRDAVAIALEIAKPPAQRSASTRKNKVIQLHTRFGGYAR